jgi:hypothetical protein
MAVETTKNTYNDVPTSVPTSERTMLCAKYFLKFRACTHTERRIGVYFTGTKDIPLECHTYVTALAKRTEPLRLTAAGGFHNTGISHDLSRMVISRKSIHHPPCLSVDKLKPAPHLHCHAKQTRQCGGAERYDAPISCLTLVVVPKLECVAGFDVEWVVS